MSKRPIHSIDAVLVFALIVASTAGAVDPNLVCWWKLDSDLTNSGATGSTNDSIAVGDPAAYVAGQAQRELNDDKPMVRHEYPKTGKIH